MLADTLRTDRARLVALTRDSKATIALRRTCRARKDLVGHRVAAANQRRAHLQTVFPGPVGLFTDLDSPISLAFLARFDCQDRAGWLSVKRLAAWLASVGYAGRVPAAELYARLVAAPRGASGSHGAVQAHITRAFLALLTTLNQQINALTAEIGQQLAAHADRQIFTSLPRSGKIRAARLLAEIGDCRRRFPTPWNRWPASSAWPLPPGKAALSVSPGPVINSSATLSATSPATAATPTPGPPTYSPSPWPRPPHAVRILARAWLFIIWRCWQQHTSYDPSRHRALQRLLDQEHQAAA